MCNVHREVIVQKPCYMTQALRVMCGLKLYETKKKPKGARNHEEQIDCQNILLHNFYIVHF